MIFTFLMSTAISRLAIAKLWEITAPGKSLTYIKVETSCLPSSGQI
jgi:hypothetical protein